MNKTRIALVGAVIALLSASTFAQNDTPTGGAKAFYAYHRTHNIGFSRASIDARKKWFSDDLYKLFLNELKREKEFLTIFAFPLPCKDPDKTEYTLQMVRGTSGWVIDNVLYAHDLNLVRDLKRTDY